MPSQEVRLALPVGGRVGGPNRTQLVSRGCRALVSDGGDAERHFRAARVVDGLGERPGELAQLQEVVAVAAMQGGTGRVNAEEPLSRRQLRGAIGGMLANTPAWASPLETCRNLQDPRHQGNLARVRGRMHPAGVAGGELDAGPEGEGEAQVDGVLLAGELDSLGGQQGRELALAALQGHQPAGPYHPDEGLDVEDDGHLEVQPRHLGAIQQDRDVRPVHCSGNSRAVPRPA